MSPNFSVFNWPSAKKHLILFFKKNNFLIKKFLGPLLKVYITISDYKIKMSEYKKLMITPVQVPLKKFFIML